MFGRRALRNTPKSSNEDVWRYNPPNYYVQGVEYKVKREKCTWNDVLLYNYWRELALRTRNDLEEEIKRERDILIER